MKQNSKNERSREKQIGSQKGHNDRVSVTKNKKEEILKGCLKLGK